MNLEWKVRLLHLMTKMPGYKQFHQLTPQEARARDQIARNFVTTKMMGEPVPLPRVEDRKINGRSSQIPLRLYYPQETEAPLPIILFFHGGGWVVGSIETHDLVCRRIAQASQRLVISVEYRLAPEHRFPTAVYDAYDALQWIGECAQTVGGDPSRIAVMGDSAGGNLAAALCQVARDEGGPAIEKQLLVYPAVDAAHLYPSALTYANAPILTKLDMDWFVDQYINSRDDIYDPRLSPLRGNLAQLPPAFIVTAEYDPLVDQGRAYAEALQHQGNQVIYKEYPRQVHGFMSIYPLASQAPAALRDMANFLR